MAWLLIPFICLAILGLLLSLIVHLSALVGLPQPLGDVTWFLHIGIFIVFLPACIAANISTKDFKQKDAQAAALRGCPRWIQRLNYGLGVYALINFVTFLAMFFLWEQVDEATASALNFRGFSGHWMIFYCGSAAMMYSTLMVRKHDPARRCLNQLPVSPSASFCESCGAQVGGGNSQSI